MHVPKWDGQPDAGDHHGFFNTLRRSSAWSFHLRDKRQAHLPHQYLQRSSACSCHLQLSLLKASVPSCPIQPHYMVKSVASLTQS